MAIEYNTGFTDAESVNNSPHDNFIYKDLNLYFTRIPVTSDVSTVTDIQDIKRAVRNLVLLNPGEKPFHPEIQCGVTKLLFNPITSPNANAIETLIETVLGSWEPRISITDIDVIPDYDQGFYYVNNGLDQAIDRGLSYAPYADMLWCETATPNLEEAKRFASDIHQKIPGK